MPADGGICGRCGARLLPGARFCTSCGAPAAAAEVPRRSSGPAPVVLPEPPRRQTPGTAPPPPPPPLPPREPPPHVTLPEGHPGPLPDPVASVARAAPASEKRAGGGLGTLIGNLLFLAVAWAAGWAAGLMVAIESLALRFGSGASGIGASLSAQSVEQAQQHGLAGAVGGAVAAILLSAVFRGRSVAGLRSFVLTFLVWVAIQVGVFQLWADGVLPQPSDHLILYAAGGGVLGLLMTLAQLGRGSAALVLRLPLAVIGAALGGAAAGAILYLA